MVFSGKPYWSLPANIPIIFESDGVVLGADGVFRRVGSFAIAATLLSGIQEARDSAASPTTDSSSSSRPAIRDLRLEEARQLLLDTKSTAVEEVND